MGNWQTFVELLLNIVTRNSGVTCLNLIQLVALLDNVGLGFLPQACISLGRLPLVPVPLNLFLVCCLYCLSKIYVSVRFLSKLCNITCGSIW